MELIDHKLSHEICVFFAQVKAYRFRAACSEVSSDEPNATSCNRIETLSALCCVAWLRKCAVSACARIGKLPAQPGRDAIDRWTYYA